MDYPLLNLIFGLALIFANSQSIALTVLLSKAPFSMNAWRAILAGVMLSLLPMLYILYLFIERMTLAFHLRLGLGLVLIVSAITGITFLLSRVHLSPLLVRVLLICLGSSILISLALAYSLYRSLVAVPLFSIWGTSL